MRCFQEIIETAPLAISNRILDYIWKQAHSNAIWETNISKTGSAWYPNDEKLKKEMYKARAREGAITRTYYDNVRKFYINKI